RRELHEAHRRPTGRRPAGSRVEAGDHDEMAAPREEVLMRIPQLKLKIRVLALVAVAGATATVALASPNRASDNRSDVQKALTKTANVKSGQFAFTFKLTGGGAGNAVNVS